MDKEKTKVIFRKWTDKNGGVIAIFPELPSDSGGAFCMSYEHIGQHGGCMYPLPRTKPAKPSEYKDLAKELRRIGYRLKIVKRSSRKDRQARREAARGVQ